MVEWMIMICDHVWRQRKVPDEWKKAKIVLLVVKMSVILIEGQICVVCLEKCMETVMEITEWKVSKEQGGFRKSKGGSLDICS